MSNLEVIDDIGGYLLSQNFYKFDSESEICDLNENDLNRIITTSNTIKITFPLGVNGIVSQVYKYTKNEPINLKILIDIINNFYNRKITKEERKILNKESGLSEQELSTLSKRIDLLKLTHRLFFEGIYVENDIYNISLGS